MDQERVPKTIQTEPKGDQKGAKREPKGSQSEPRNFQKHHLRNRVEKVRKTCQRVTVFGSHFAIFLIQQLKKTRLGNQLGSDTEKVTKTTGKLSPTESKWVPEFVLNRNGDLMEMIFFLW